VEKDAFADAPNIVFILADDLAWSDLACCGHPWHETPHLDRLAEQGIRFTDAYAAAPICSASRASIMTGKTPARLGFEFVTKVSPGRQTRLPGQSLDTPPFTLNLPLQEQTIAERLSRLGYATALFGKWHLNAHHNGYLGWSPTHGPKSQGFAEAVEDFGSHPYSYQGQPDKPPRVSTRGVIPEDGMTCHAVDFVASAGERPYFLMVSHFFVHTPVETECDWLLQKYNSRVPHDAANRERRVKYGAFVETLDHHVGRLLRAIDDAGQRENTLVLFTSDNGGHPQYASNAPLRGSKWNLYEGGIRVPMIARWPGRITAGSVSKTPVVGYDLLPTFVEVAGEGGSLPHSEIDGRSLVGVLKDPGLAVDRDLYWHFPYYHPERGYREALDAIGVDDFAVSKTRPQSAIRRGRRKLLAFYDGQPAELYDLAEDPSELDDLSMARPGLTRRLSGALHEYLNRVGARLPKP
jgi:uncharacterized sulfatase